MSSTPLPLPHTLPAGYMLHNICCGVGFDLQIRGGLVPPQDPAYYLTCRKCGAIVAFLRYFIDPSGNLPYGWAVGGGVIQEPDYPIPQGRRIKEDL